MSVVLGTPSSYSFNNSSDSRAVTVDAGSNFLIVCIDERFDRGASQTVTYNGVTMTKLVGLNSGSLQGCYVYYLANPATGSNTLAISGLSSTTGVVVGVLPLSGVDTTNPFRSQGANNYLTATGNPAANSTLTLTTAAGDLAISTIGMDATTDTTLTASLTQQWQLRQIEGANATRGAGQTTSPAGSSQACTWTFASRNFTHIAFSVVAAAATAATPQRTLMGVGT